MTKNKCIIITILAIIFGAVILVLGYTTFKQNRPAQISQNIDKIKIGVITPLSGDSAFMGEDLQKGINLAAKNFEQAELIFEDNQGATQNMVSAYHKLKTINNPDVIIAISTGVEAIIPLAEKDKIPLFLTVSSASGIPAQGDYIFRYFTNADIDAPIMAKYATQTLGLKKLTILALQDQFAIDYVHIFTQEIKKYGGEIVGQENFGWTDFDYKTQLVKLKDKNFDGLYLIGLDYQLLTVLKQIQELQIQGVILSVGTIATKNSIDKAEGSMEGVYLTSFCLDETPENYAQKYQQEYNSYPGFFSGLGYDMINMIEAAVKQNGAGKEGVRQGLSAIKNFPSNSGIITADSVGEMVIPTCVKKIENGKIFNITTGQYSNF